LNLRDKIKELEEQADRQSNKIIDLDARYIVAVERLGTIADGSYYGAECEGMVNDANRLKRTAAIGLVKLAKMRQR
jgi:hypothetical protein